LFSFRKCYVRIGFVEVQLRPATTTIAGGRAGEHTIVSRDIITISYAAVECRLTGKPYQFLAVWFKNKNLANPKPAAANSQLPHGAGEIA